MKTFSVCTHSSCREHHYSIAGCIETLRQGLSFLSDLSADDYVAVVAPYVTSSIGEHFRHWLDLFHAVKSWPEHIDYNQRRRGHAVEMDIQIARREINDFIEWVSSLRQSELVVQVTVESEMLLSQSRVETVVSSLGREICFVTLHATHHFAMAKVIASLLNVTTDVAFGVAPATASYRRSQ